MTQTPGALLEVTRASIVAVDERARAGALDAHNALAKPPGALGRLESLGAQLAAIAATSPPPRPHPAAVAVFAGDHGVVAQGVTPWPSAVTTAMVATFVAGGAAISVLARTVGATVEVVDVGMAEPAGDLARIAETARNRSRGGEATLSQRKVRAGTGDISVEPAMTTAEATAAIEVGIETAQRLIGAGARGLVMGEMGIGNTTPSAALIAALCGVDAAAATGRGTGIDDERLAHKVDVVATALARARGATGGLDSDPLRTLAELGGLEIAALCGLALGGAAARVPVLVDGVIALAATLVAARLCPEVVGYCIAGHRSTEPGASIALETLGLSPLLELGMRLGEGSGACLALPLLDGAARVLGEMATLAEAIG